MYTMLLTGIIIGAVAFVLALLMMDSSVLDSLAAGAIVGAIAGFFIGGFIAMGLAPILTHQEWVVAEKVELVGVYDKSSIEGRFFLFSGYVNQKESFVFWRKEPNGEQWKDSVPVSTNARFVEKDNLPMATLTIKKEKGVPNHPGDENWTFPYDGSGKTYLFEVPTGTVDKRFQVQ